MKLQTSTIEYKIYKDRIEYKDYLHCFLKAVIHPLNSESVFNKLEQR